MEWQGEATVIARRPHGEHAVILTALSRDAGLVSGAVPGGASVKRAAMLQPGNRLSLRWRARLDDQLGSFAVEPGRARPGLMADADALSGLNAITALIRWGLPERDPHPRLADATEALLDTIDSGAAASARAAGAGGLSAPRAPRGYLDEEEAAGAGWAADYLRWEILLLDELGFGLSLDRCAVTGARTGLAYVSPRTGHAVTAAAAGEWASRLFRLPALLGGAPARDADVAEDLAAGLALTRHFLIAQLAEGQVGRPLPVARDRLVARLVGQRAIMEKDHPEGRP